MDKSSFVRTAPTYYALAIAVALRERGGVPTSRAAMLKHYTVPSDEDPDEGYCYLQKRAVFDRAVTWLADREMIDIVTDDFGPPFFQAGNGFEARYNALLDDETTPFQKYHQLRGETVWLLDALRSVNAAYDDLEIAPADFDQPDKEWEPLPLDRNEPKLETAIAALDKTAELVRADNGYSANFPEERDYTLTTLCDTVDKLKNAETISVGYLRRGTIEALTVLIRRFKKAAIGLAATAARQAIVQWLTHHGVQILTTFFG